MIVECSHCHTKFNLPDDKVKPEGVKIRCTRCKNVFEVLPPGHTAPPEDSFSAGSDDLSGFDDDGGDLSSDSAADSDVTGDIDQDLGGDDFGLDASDSDFDLDSDLDIGDQDQKSADSDSLEFEMDSDAGTAAGPDRAPASTGPVKSAAAAESDFDLDKDLDSDLGDLDLSFDDAPAPAAAETTATRGAAPGAATDFDLSFGEAPAPKGTAVPPIPASQPIAGTTAGNDFAIGDDSLLGGKDDLGFSDSIGIESRDAPFGDMEEPMPMARTKKKAARRSPLTVAALILLFLLAGGYWVYSAYFSKGFDPEKILSLFSGTEDPLANLENAEMKMHYYYVVNSQAGKILVLEGAVINHSTYDKGRIKVKVTLYDKNGKALGTSESYCGNVLELKELETLPKKDIIKLLSVQSGKKFDNAHIKSNESIPYMLAVFSVPAGTEGFVVTVVGAQNVGE